MTTEPAISDQALAKLGELPTQTLIDGLWVENWPQAMIHGARLISPEQKMVGRAVTLRFVPHRPDILADKPKAEDSPAHRSARKPRIVEPPLKNSPPPR